MPGIEARAPERTETSSGRLDVAEVGADRVADEAHGLVDLRLEAVGQLAALRVVGVADLGGDGEAGRHGQAEARHLGEIGALAAEQLRHVGTAVDIAGGEGVDPFRLALHRLVRHLASSPRRYRPLVGEPAVVV